MLQDLRRPEEAERSYRESIAHDEWLAKHVSDPAGVRWVVANHQGALAQVLLQLGRRDQARALLDRASEELEALADEGPRFPGAGRHFAECITRMTGAYEELGETDRAAELNERAAELRHRHEPRFGRDPGRGAGREHPGEPRRPDAGPRSNPARIAPP